MTVLAMAFDSPELAHQALAEARRLHEQHQVELHDLVVVSAEDGAPTVVESMDPTPLAMAVPSTLVGALGGAIAFGPLGFLIGSLIAGTTGVLVTKLVDTGIPHKLVAQLRKRLRRGQSIVAVLVDEGAAEPLRRLRGARVVYDH